MNSEDLMAKTAELVPNWVLWLHWRISANGVSGRLRWCSLQSHWRQGQQVVSLDLPLPLQNFKISYGKCQCHFPVFNGHEAMKSITFCNKKVVFVRIILSWTSTSLRPRTVGFSSVENNKKRLGRQKTHQSCRSSQSQLSIEAKTLTRTDPQNR